MEQSKPPAQRERIDTANLRLEVNALTAKIDSDALPQQLSAVRKTITWSALAIAAALIFSGALHWCGTSKVEKLERRLERLERKIGP